MTKTLFENKERTERESRHTYRHLAHLHPLPCIIQVPSPDHLQVQKLLGTPSLPIHTPATRTCGAFISYMHTGLRPRPRVYVYVCEDVDARMKEMGTWHVCLCRVIGGPCGIRLRIRGTGIFVAFVGEGWPLKALCITTPTCPTDICTYVD